MATPTPTTTLAKEVYFRTLQKLTVEQCAYFLNHAMQILTAAGNFPWDQTSDYTAAVADAYVPALGNMDLGKKISCFNDNRLPIVRVRQDDYDFSAAGYLNTATTYYNSFRTAVSSLTGSPYIQFFPSLVVQPNIHIYYHMLPPVLTYSAASAPRWVNKWMDNLLCDFAEAEIKRLLGFQDAAILEQRCIARLKEATVSFSTERENTGPPAEVATAAAEKTQVGRI